MSFNPQLSTCLLLCQREVELLLFEIGLRHLNLYWVAQLILAVMSATHESVVALVEVVVVVVKIAHGDKSLAVVLVYLALYSVRLNARDVGIVDIADALRHKLHSLVLYRVALGIGCNLLHLR